MKGIITGRAYGLKKEILYLILNAPQFLQWYWSYAPDLASAFNYLAGA